MKLLLVIPTVFGGGAEQVAATLSREWVKAHELSVLCWASETPGQCFDFGVPVRYADLGVQQGLLARVRNVWRRIRMLRDVVRTERPDAVLAFMDEAGIPCALAAALDGWRERLIVSVHHNPQWMPRWRRVLLGFFYRLPAKVVAVSQGVRDELVRSCALPAARLHHLPNPLADTPQTLHPEDENLLRDLGEGYLLAVGRLDIKTKGFDLLIEAYAGLPAGRPRLVVLGEGAGRNWIEAEIVRRGLATEVMLHGWVKDPRPFYRRARAFVLSSRYEGWSNVLMEAMGEGCVVVAARCPYGPAEILGDELSHCLVAPEDAAALREGMMRALALDADTRKQLGTALRERVQRFAADKVAAQWIALAASMKGRQP